MKVSTEFQPAWDYADTAANQDGQALFSCEFVKDLLERISSRGEATRKGQGLCSYNEEVRAGEKLFTAFKLLRDERDALVKALERSGSKIMTKASSDEQITRRLIDAQRNRLAELTAKCAELQAEIERLNGTIRRINVEHREEIREIEKDARGAVTEARWQAKQGDEYGSW